MMILRSISRKSRSKLILRLVSTLILVTFAGSSGLSQAALAAQQTGESPPDQSKGNTLYMPLIYHGVVGGSGAGWPMVGANPERTSWTPVEVSGSLEVEWYLPVEAYISQNTQIIASNGLLYLTTARGLYALDAASGALAWRYDTEIPLGNSPTISGGVLYVGGYDRKLHALDARSGAHLWEFDGAGAGFSTNPLVVEGKVIAGSRDGALYAIGAHGASNGGKLIWKFQTGGPINFSAAYKDGVVYFASNDNYAYAVRAGDGGAVWKSALLPGDGFNSYWPVIFGDKVIFAGAFSYRHETAPGTATLKSPEGNAYSNANSIQIDDLFFDKPQDSAIGPSVDLSSESWAGGKKVIDGSRFTQYLESNATPDLHLHKPWRRVSIILNRSDGSEYTYDSDQDGSPEYAPFGHWGTRSGNTYPAVLGPNGVIYQNNIYTEAGQGQIMGWKMGTPYLNLVGGQGAVDEPQALSMGGNLIYRSVCCDRVGDYVAINSSRTGTLWHYNKKLSDIAPGYDEMWTLIPHPEDLPRLWGNFGNLNGVYHNHGDQNPIIPYNGRLYVHRSNAVIAFGPGPARGKLPLLKIQPVADTVSPLTAEELKLRLADEVQKMIAAGHLRPGYYNAGQFGYKWKHLSNYFENPGDTLYTLARAYPHLSPDLQQAVRAYLQAEFQKYFDTQMVARTGWAEGAAREAMPLPPDVASSLAGLTASTEAGLGWSWKYPQNNFYALWKYAEIFPESAGRAYQLAKSKLKVPAIDDAYLAEYPYEHNGYIAGYLGFLNLQELAGMTGQDSSLRSQVSAELNRLLQLRANAFSKDSPWYDDEYHRRPLNIARNFMLLVPELGDYLNQNALSKMKEALQEYNTVAPYWFVSRYNAVANEGTLQHLYDANALFQARAYILKEPRQELIKYLDAPGFERGDLLYIQNLITAIEAPG